MEWYIWLGIAVAGLIGALIFEPSREYLAEAFEYFISFEWLGDFVELIGSAFEDIGELSFVGLAFGAIGTGLIFFFRENLINSFLQYYDPVPRIIWTVLTYVVVFVGCYFLGRGMERS